MALGQDQTPGHEPHTIVPYVACGQKLDPESHTVLLDLDLEFDAGQTCGIPEDAQRRRSAWQLLGPKNSSAMPDSMPSGTR